MFPACCPYYRGFIKNGINAIHYKIFIDCIHSDSHPVGPIIGLATCFGLFFVITVAISTVLLVLCVNYFKKMEKWER